VTTLMLERFCFPHKVARQLSKLGWPPDMIPRKDPTFLQLCDALKLGGYNVDRAAQLWHSVFTGDIDARQELRANTGLYGAVFLADNGEWRGMAGSSFFVLSLYQP
jgi:hypothetical protein